MDTIEVTTYPFSGRLPSFFASERRYSRSIAPIWFPVSFLYSPSSYTATPSLSESGSVTIMMSAIDISAYFLAKSYVSSYSGFGTLKLGKSPSGLSCSFTANTFSYPSSRSDLLTGSLPEPLSGEYTMRSEALDLLLTLLLLNESMIIAS